MNQDRNRQPFTIITVIFLFAFFACILPYLPGHEFDNLCWKTWSAFIHDQGLRNAYASGTDYLPLYHYVLWAFGKVQGSSGAIFYHMPYIRLVTLAFDFAGIWYVYRWIGKKQDFFLLLLFSMLNVSFIYNSVFWGQVDSIFSALAFVSIYYAAKQKVVWSGIFFILALNMKLQAIVFLPVWGLLCLHALWDRKKWQPALYALAAMLVVQFLILFPFFRGNGGVAAVWNVVVNSVDKYPRVSMNAYNFWHLVIKGDPWNVFDDAKFLGPLSYKQVGLFLFFATSLAALWPLMISLVQKFRGKPTVLTKEQIWISCSLVSLLFFFFNTQMHERYCHPAFLFLTAYAFYTGRFFAYILFSVAYFLTLERVLQFLRLSSYDHFYFHPAFIALLFGVLIPYLFYRLFRRSERQEDAGTLAFDKGNT